MSDPTRQLTVVPVAKAQGLSATIADSIVVPAIIADAGDQAARRFLEFFAATIRNKNTRTGLPAWREPFLRLVRSSPHRPARRHRAAACGGLH